MAVSSEAARALDLISGISFCKQVPAGFWPGVVTRIVTDLDEVAAEREVIRIRELLAAMWHELDDKPAETPPLRQPG